MNEAPREPVFTPGPGHGRAAVLFALVGLFAYFNSLHGDYLLDDYRFTNEPRIGHPFGNAMAARPVISLSLAVNYWIDGLNPRGYHAMNLFAHVLAGFILYDLVRLSLLAARFGGRFDSSAGWIGLVAGLVWMVHPLNTQSVTYIIQRCESFMGLFFLASLWCYVRGATAERGLRWNIAAVLLCALGAGCKEMMIVLAPLALLYDRAFLTGSWRESLRRWPMMLLLALPPVAGLAALAFTGFFTDPAGTVGFGVKVYTPYTYALTQTEVILHYLRLSLLPVGLTLDYLDWKPCTSLADCWASVSAIAILVAITAVGVLRNFAWAYPAAWFFICLAPTSTIVPVQDAAFEHRMYLPLAGVVALVVCGVANFARGRVVGYAGGVVILALGLMTAARNEDYSSASRLLADNAAKRPANGRVRLNLAIQLFGSGDVAGAEAQLNEALKLPLQLPALRSEHIKVLREAGKTAEAVEVSRQMLAARPDSVDASYELGLSLLTDNRPAEALPYLQQAAEKGPSNKFARLHYAIALARTDQLSKARPEYQATHGTDPGYADQLIAAARRIANDPDAKPSHLRLALWYADAACSMKTPNTAEFLDTLAMCESRMGRFDEAVTAATRAAEQARSRGDVYLAARCEAHAALYRQHKPNLP